MYCNNNSAYSIGRERSCMSPDNRTVTSGVLCGPLVVGLTSYWQSLRDEKRAVSHVTVISQFIVISDVTAALFLLFGNVLLSLESW